MEEMRGRPCSRVSNRRWRVFRLSEQVAAYHPELRGGKVSVKGPEAGRSWERKEGRAGDPAGDMGRRDTAGGAGRAKVSGARPASLVALPFVRRERELERGWPPSLG